MILKFSTTKRTQPCLDPINSLRSVENEQERRELTAKMHITGFVLHVHSKKKLAIYAKKKIMSRGARISSCWRSVTESKVNDDNVIVWLDQTKRLWDTNN